MISGLDHVNIRTTQLDAMILWYGQVLGLQSGWRPNFPFGGAWLYAGDAPVVHLVTVDEKTEPPSVGVQLEHAAFKATGFSGFIATLTDRGEKHQISKVPDAGIVQVNVWDPDGNHLHIDFPASEESDS